MVGSQDPLQLMSEREVIDLLKVSAQFLKRRRDAGHIRYYRMGARIMYKREDVVQYLREWCEVNPE